MIFDMPLRITASEPLTLLSTKFHTTNSNKGYINQAVAEQADKANPTSIKS